MNRLLPLATLRRIRRARKPSGLVITSVKIPRTLDKALKAEARRQDRSQAWVIRDALQSYISFRQASKT